MKIYVLPVIIMLIITLVIDVYIYFQIKANNKSTLKLYRSLHIAATTIIGAFAIFTAFAPKSLWINHIPTMSLLIYAFISIVLVKVVFVLISLTKAFWHSAKAKRRVSNVAALLATAVLCYMWYASAVTRYDIEVKHIEISHPLVPESFDGYRIAQFSDFHLGSLHKDTPFVNDVVKAINAENADMIVFTGDLANSTSKDVEPFVEQLSRLHAPDGVISIMGNHDYGDYYVWDSPDKQKADIENMHRLQRSAGWRLLLDETVAVTRGNDSIMIIGVENIGNSTFHTYGDLRKAYKTLNDNKFKVLLSHCTYPWDTDIVPNTNIALTLSGHTHAMQTEISLFGKKYSPASLMYTQWAGLYSKGDQHIYVNIGVGSIGIPARFGARPEITIFTLRHKE